MNNDFAATCALETYSRAAKILPLLDSWLEIEGHPALTETQRIGVGSVVLQVFAGLEETLGRMVSVQDVFEAFRQRAGVSEVEEPEPLGDAVERWLASREFEEGLQ